MIVGRYSYGTNLLHSNGYDAPPVVIAFRQHHSGMQAATIVGHSSQAKIVWFNLTP